MNIKAISVAFIAFALTWPVAALPQEAKPQPQQAKPQPQQQSQPLLSGNGWRVVRSVQFGNSGKYIHLVLIDAKRDMDKALYGSAQDRICRSEPDFCRIRFWNELRHIPEKVSLTEAQQKALRAEYIFNREGGVQQMRYACTVVSDKNQCFSY